MQAPGWFRDPDLRFRPAAFWFWHHVPGEAEIAARLAEIAASGLGTILIQARLAMPLSDYLSPAYLDACRLASAEAGRLGLGVEIYDEYNWMSGHGGGRTVEGADHLRERHLFWASAVVESGAASWAIENIRSPWLEFLGRDGLDWCYEGGAPRFDEWTVVAVHGSAPDGAPPDLAARTRVLPAGPAGCRITIEAGSLVPDGARLTAFVSARCASSRLVNYLLPETAERFASLVYAPLVEAAGGGARSVFFDHPYAGFYRWDGLAGDLGNSLLWDAELPGHLPAEPLELQLAALVGDVGPGTAGLRARFFEAYAGRMHAAFFGTLRRWCDERGLDFTGHELLTHVGGWGLHDGLPGIDPRSMPGVDSFGLDRYRTQTSVDAADYRPQLAAKLGDSVARANGRSRCTVEQYSTGREVGLPGSAGQWGLTLERLRAQAIRHTLFGARRILLHALCLTDGFEPGERAGPNPRFDFPPGFNFQPWWQDAPETLAELARLSAFLEDGTPVRPVALLYPLETIRAGATAPECGRQFGWWAEALSEAGIGFDVVDESAFEAADSSDGKLLLASGCYETLILPAVTTLASPSSAALLARFANAGGHLVASGPLPSHSKARGGDDAVAIAIREAMAAAQALHVPEADRNTVRDIVAALPRGVLRFEAGPSWVSAAVHDETLRLATFNDAGERRIATLDLGPAAVEIHRWRPASGERTTLGRWPGGLLRVELAAQALLCLEIAPVAGPITVPPPVAIADAPPPIPLPDGWLFSTREGGEPFRPIATDRGWERQGFDRFAGTGLYRRAVPLPPPVKGLVWHLVLPDLRDTGTCRIDGAPTGRSVAGEAAFAMPPGRGTRDLVLEIRNTAANRTYAETPFAAAANQPSGLLAAPRLEARSMGATDIKILPQHEA